jgi:nucleotide-binding universal stress UspA family protein
MFRNILLSIDGSCHSERALTEAIELAEASQGRLTILTAVPQPTAWGASTTATAAISGSLAEELEAESRRIMRAAVERVPASVPVTKILTHAPVRAALHEQLQAGRYDLLVVGSRGRGALSSSLMGSVSHYVLNHAKIPVLIVHAEGEQPAAELEPGASVMEEAPALT